MGRGGGYRALLNTYLRPQGWRVALMATLLVVSIALQALGPQVLRRFLDRLTAGASESTLAWTGLLFLAVVIGGEIVAALATYVSAAVGWSATNALRADLALHCLRLDLRFHQARSPGELIERIDGDVSVLGNFFSWTRCWRGARRCGRSGRWGKATVPKREGSTRAARPQALIALALSRLANYPREMERRTIATELVELRGIPVFLRHSGAGDGPALVLLHGLPTSSFLWRRCLPALAAALPGWRIIAPDLPGYGHSAPRPGAGPRHLGNFLHALLGALGVGRFVLAGHDLGGLVALTDAVARTGPKHPAAGAPAGNPPPGYPPQRVVASRGPQLERLILLDTTIYPAPLLVAGLLPAIVPPFADLSLAWLGRGGPMRDDERRARYIAGMRQLLAPGTALTEAEWAEYALPYGPVAGWREATRSLRALAAQAPFVLRCLAHLGDLTLPTRLIWAEHDPFFPLATAERLRRAIPGAEREVHVIPGSGHFPQEDQPEEVSRLIAEFVGAAPAGDRRPPR